MYSFRWPINNYTFSPLITAILIAIVFWALEFIFLTLLIYLDDIFNQFLIFNLVTNFLKINFLHYQLCYKTIINVKFIIIIIVQNLYFVFHSIYIYNL